MGIRFPTDINLVGLLDSGCFEHSRRQRRRLGRGSSQGGFRWHHLVTIYLRLAQKPFAAAAILPQPHRTLGAGVQFRRPRQCVPGRVPGQMREEAAEQRLQPGNRQRNKGSCYLGVFDAHHRVVGPTSVGGPLAFDHEPDADTGNDNDAV